MSDELWRLDTEYEDHLITKVTKTDADRRSWLRTYVIEIKGVWSLLWEGCDFEPQVGDTARYFGKGIGFDVRGIVCFPRQGGMPLVVRYMTPEQAEAKHREWKANYDAEVAAREKRPRVELDGRVFDSDMAEISGFGGGYEACCRKMALAGMKWCDDNPPADPKFHGYEGVFGVIAEDNDDAKALSKAINDAADGGGATGAMHQACVSHALAYRRLGWDAYRAEMMKLRPSDDD